MSNAQTVIPIVASEGSTSIYTENLEQCLKSTYRLAEVVYTNICDGTIQSVPMGFWDIIVIGGVVMALASAFVVFLKVFFFD